METTTVPTVPSTPSTLPAAPAASVASAPPVPGEPESSALSRRGFLRAAAVTGGGLVAVGVAACAPAAGAPAWTYGPTPGTGNAASPGT